MVGVQKSLSILLCLGLGLIACQQKAKNLPAPSPFPSQLPPSQSVEGIISNPPTPVPPRFVGPMGVPQGSSVESSTTPTYISLKFPEDKQADITLSNGNAYSVTLTDFNTQEGFIAYNQSMRILLKEVKQIQFREEVVPQDTPSTDRLVHEKCPESQKWKGLLNNFQSDWEKGTAQIHLATSPSREEKQTVAVMTRCEYKIQSFNFSLDNGEIAVEVGNSLKE